MKYTFVIALFWLASCSTSLDTTHLFRVRMKGIYVAPSTLVSDAEYSKEPSQAKFKLLGVKLLRGTDTALTLYSGDPVDLSILDRGQRIYEKQIKEDWRLGSDGSAQSFTGVVATFDTAWGCVTSEGELSKTLTSGEVTLTSDFTIGKAQDKTFTVNVKWKEIVKTDGSDCKEPELEIVSTTAYD